MSQDVSSNRYGSWGNFLKAKRAQRFRSAREFCNRLPVGISYPQYSRYEAGDQLPSLEHALKLSKLLDLDLLEVLLEWNRAQVSDVDSRAKIESLLQEVLGAGRKLRREKGAPPFPLDETLVFNRSHLRLFQAEPICKDILTYVKSRSRDWIQIEELTDALEIEESQASELLHRLEELGVVAMDGARFRACKRHFYYPDDEDFFGLKNQSLSRHAGEVLRTLSAFDLKQSKAYREVVTRALTPEQVETIVGKLEGLISDANGLPVPVKTDDSRVFALCVLLGERFPRKSRLDRPQSITLDRKPI